MTMKHRRKDLRLYWDRFLCHVLGHDMDYDHYIAGSFEMECLRCGHTDRI